MERQSCWLFCNLWLYFTHLRLLPHTCLSELSSIGSGDGLSHLWHQAITWNNTGLLSIGLLGTNFSEIWIRILSFSFKEMHLKLSSAYIAAILSRRRWVKEFAMITSKSSQQYRDHFVYAPSQRETTLCCNVVSNWLGTYAKWSLVGNITTSPFQHRGMLYQWARHWMLGERWFVWIIELMSITLPAHMAGGSPYWYW